MEKKSNGKAGSYIAPQIEHMVLLFRESFCGSAYSIPKLEEENPEFIWE